MFLIFSAASCLVHTMWYLVASCLCLLPHFLCALCFVASERLSMFLFKVSEQDNMLVVMMAYVCLHHQFLSPGQNLLVFSVL